MNMTENCRVATHMNNDFNFSIGDIKESSSIFKYFDQIFPLFLLTPECFWELLQLRGSQLILLTKFSSTCAI